MKCIYCGKRIAMLRKLTDSEFCSDMHRRLYQQEHETMALARLMDTQKRYDALTALGGSTKGCSREIATDRDAIAARLNEPVKGFLPQVPVSRLLTGCRLPAIRPLAQHPEAYHPEYRFSWYAHPPFSGYVELPGFNPRPFSFSPRYCDVYQAIELAAWLPRAEARLQIRGLAAAGSQPWYWTKPVPAAIGLRAVQASPEHERLPLIPPLLSSSEFLTLTRAGLRAFDAPPPGRALAPTPKAMETLTAGFPAKVCFDLLSRVLEPVEPTSISVYRETPGAEEIPSRKLLALARSGISERRQVIRRVRARELFFPLPRLGDLPALASRVAGENIHHQLYSGTRGRDWKPGMVPHSFDSGVLDARTGPGPEAFSPIPVEVSKVTVLPLRSAPLPPAEGLAPAARVDGGYLEGADPLSTGYAIRSRHGFAEPVTPEAVRPGFLAAAASLVLGQPRNLYAVAAHASAGSFEVRRPVTAVCACPVAEPAPPPLYAGGLARAVLAIPAVSQMAQIQPSPGRATALGCLWIEPDLLEEAPQKGATHTGASCPASVLRSRFEPGFANQVFATAPSEGIPYPSNTVAVQEFSPLWPDPACTLPQVRIAIVEDHGIREAVRAINVVLAQQRRSWIPSLPSMSMPHFERPDLKWFVMSVPLLLLVAVYSLTNSNDAAPLIAANGGVEKQEAATAVGKAPEPRHSAPVVPVAAVATAAVPAPAAPTGFAKIKQSILERAAVSLSDDFRAGLGDWEGKGNWSAQWSYDPSGFLRTGPLALYKPSLSLRDYRMEFLGQIEKKSMGWVYRATDPDNYYATKIVITKGGPLPTAIIERYAVINGKESSLQRRPLPLQVRADMLYRVRMDVRGGGFTLSVEGQIVDYWSDERLKSGGIGFFSGKGELARLRWVEVSHQYDFLGRLCAFLAPYSVPAKEGSLKQ